MSFRPRNSSTASCNTCFRTASCASGITACWPIVSRGKQLARCRQLLGSATASGGRPAPHGRRLDARPAGHRHHAVSLLRRHVASAVAPAVRSNRRTEACLPRPQRQLPPLGYFLNSTSRDDSSFSSDRPNCEPPSIRLRRCCCACRGIRRPTKAPSSPGSPKQRLPTSPRPSRPPSQPLLV